MGHCSRLAGLAVTPLCLWSGACITSIDTCVAAGSRVATPDGWLNIELLQVGDEVFAVDPATGTVHATTITAVRRSQRECVALVSAAGHTLHLTPDHPVYAPEVAGFVEAGRLVLGQTTQVLIVEDQPTARAEVTSVGPCSRYAGVFEVFDLTVAGPYPTFIAEGFVVHNKSFDPTATTGLPNGDPPTTSTETTPTTTDTSSTSDATDTSSTSAASSTGDASSTSDVSSTGDATSTSDATGTSDTTGGVGFACGRIECEVGEDYCEVFYPGQPDSEITFTCIAVPPACQPQPSCACLAARDIFGECSVTPEGGLLVEIFAP